MKNFYLIFIGVSITILLNGCMSGAKHSDINLEFTEDYDDNIIEALTKADLATAETTVFSTGEARKQRGNVVSIVDNIPSQKPILTEIDPTLAPDYDEYNIPTCGSIFRYLL